MKFFVDRAFPKEEANTNGKDQDHILDTKYFKFSETLHCGCLRFVVLHLF